MQKFNIGLDRGLSPGTHALRARVCCYSCASGVIALSSRAVRIASCLLRFHCPPAACCIVRSCFSYNILGVQKKLRARKVDLWSKDYITIKFATAHFAGGPTCVAAAGLGSNCPVGASQTGELYMIVREIERSIQEIGMGDVVTMQTCLRSVARACVFTDAVSKASASHLH